MSRTATITRTTKETSVAITIDLDGSGASRIETPVGLFGEQTTTTPPGAAAPHIASSGKRPVAGSISTAAISPPAIVISFS